MLKKEVNRMSHCVVRLNGTEEVEEFVKAASKCDFDIDIFYNRVIIDAKSILGILSMDPVSYTHLDVYKRQGLYRGYFLCA